MNYKRRKQPKGKRWAKQKGFVVKGITQRHWWDFYDKDSVRNSRQLLKAELRERLNDVE